MLTASNTLADADGLGTISYQWQRDGVNVAGATGTDLHAGRCRCRPHHRCGGELHRRPRHAESVTSAATAAVTNVNDAPTGTVTISGTAPGEPGPDGLEHAGGCRRARHDQLPVAARRRQRRRRHRHHLHARQCRCRPHHRRGGELHRRPRHGRSVTSAATAAVTNVNDPPTGTVTISGTAQENQVLTASNTLADADGLGTISYQWQRDGVNVAGATGPPTRSAMPMSATPSMWWRATPTATARPKPSPVRRPRRSPTSTIRRPER